MNGISSDAKGRRAENVAALTLRFQGWQIVGRRFTSGRGSGAGEVDLVARKGKILAFIEVKARPTCEEALAALTNEQKKRIARGAEAWMAKNPAESKTFIRFDVIAVPESGRPLHLADAWRPDF
jgi:putative endonuclease